MNLVGDRTELRIGSVTIDAVADYHPDGRLAALRQGMQVLSFGTGSGPGEHFVALEQFTLTEIRDRGLDGR